MLPFMRCGCTATTRFSSAVILSSVFQRIFVKRCSNPHGYWRFLTRTTPRHPPNLGQTSPGLLPLQPGLLSVVVYSRPGNVGLASSAAALEEQLIDEALAAPAAMHDQIFEVFQPRQMPS